MLWVKDVPGYKYVLATVNLWKFTFTLWVKDVPGYKYVSAAVNLQKFTLWVKDVPGYKYMSTVNLKLKVAISW